MKKVFLTILLALTSCSLVSTHQPASYSIFANSSCDLPCWYGIAIGKTTKQELLGILQGISFVNQDSITVIESTSFFDEWVYFSMGKGPKILEVEGGGTVQQDYLWAGEVYLLNGKVSQIILGGDLGLTIQQVVDAFGTPSYAIPSFTPGGHVWVSILFPAKGVDIGYRVDDVDAEITPDTKISRLKLFDISLFDEMIQNQMFMFSSMVVPDEIINFGWKGYGSLSLYWSVK